MRFYPFLFDVYEYLTCIYCAYRDQQRVLDYPRLELKMIVSRHGCWGLKLGPLEEQPLVLTLEPSHQPLQFFIFILDFWKYSMCIIFTSSHFYLLLYILKSITSSVIIILCIYAC